MDYKKILKILEAEVGYVEGANNNNKYGKDYGLNNQPYCVIFMWWGFYKAGASECFCGGTKLASCTKVKEWAQAHGCWVTKNYQPGDLLMFNFNGGNTTKHIGFLKEIKNGVYYTIEGNTSASGSGSQDDGEGVRLKQRKLGQIVGAYRPNYAGAPSTSKKDTKPKYKNIAGLYKLEKGHTGDAVVALQTLLNLRMNAGLVVDGDFGGATEKALNQFIEKYHLKTKICERAVWEKLING